MKKPSVIDLAVLFLKENKGYFFTANEIALAIYNNNIDLFADRLIKHGGKKAFLRKLSRGVHYSEYAKKQQYKGVIHYKKDERIQKIIYWYDDMEKISKNSLIIQFLKNNQGKKFTTKQIVEHVYQLNPEFFAEKKAALEKQGRDFWQQLRAECGYVQLSAYHHVIKREKDPVLKKDVLWYEDNSSIDVIQEPQPPYKPTEHDLYPILMRWLRNELGLYCLRIVERTSSNSKGKNGNKWLHPDIVAMKVLDQNWHKVVKDCVKASSSQRVELFSFEVKKEITMSDVREYFFQTVSNSSWANEGYLVATSISDEAVKEL
ncbi:hypothetical protein [Bibersteinia trehalosi]|uniref:hypothetical protein n=1 Tax=Bibersteinia trehalosi TaxID=47735 RepID=UPI000AB3E9EF|nr:hypothetical protein [Bibersteinia trehalosi]